MVRPTGSLAWCGACFYLEETLNLVGVGTVDDLAQEHVASDAFLARVADLLRRTHVEDAERLVQKIEALDRRARGITGPVRPVAPHLCETPSEALAMHHAEQAVNGEG